MYIRQLTVYTCTIFVFTLIKEIYVAFMPALTPRSRHLTLTECSGCPLDNSSTDTTRSTNSHYFNQFPCRICLPHNEVVKLNVLLKKKFSCDLPMEFNTTLTNITSDINACFNAPTNRLTIDHLASSGF